MDTRRSRPLEGGAADQREAAEAEEDDRATAGAWWRGLGELPNETLREAGLILWPAWPERRLWGQVAGVL